MVEIEVVSLCDLEGHTKPLRFRVIENKESKIIKVDKVLFVDINKYLSFSPQVYKCESVIRDQRKVYELLYFKDENKWKLKR
ncbi:hypothetical protein RH915_05865 [Serpentinicella sp. ANB-PHB4]|uniref:hypothetical protein n=1 Tax=Serpentinicella sp. ANB-PHB4 TaxID=3074076 RepID=UPI00286607BA|nr:hypothetical protein [Serpentinicella sp. ANB-PHB4]MDR5659009.1 hypothetical protein [Serpentinicella sp. ANB-PHB4]